MRKKKTANQPLEREGLIPCHSCFLCVLTIRDIIPFASLSLEHVLHPKLYAAILKLILLAKLPTLCCKVLPSQPNYHHPYEISCAYFQDFIMIEPVDC